MNNNSISDLSGLNSWSDLKPLSKQASVRAGSPHLKRHLEVDAIRGLAVVLMITFHFLFDLHAFAKPAVMGQFVMPWWFWKFGPKVIGTLFLSVLGISAWLKYQKYSHYENYKTFFFRRGFQILLAAMGVTVVTRTFAPQMAIYFGVLHCIGVSLLLIPIFLRRYYLNLFLGILFLGLGIFLNQFQFSFPGLLWLGFWHERGAGSDWYPLLPYFGIVLLGLFFGRVYYSNGHGRDLNPRLLNTMVSRILIYLGQHSLKIYLAHQPMLLGVLYLFGLSRFNNS